MTAPIPSTAAGKPQTHRGSRQDGKNNRPDTSRPVAGQGAAHRFPERVCARPACSKKFRPTKRPDQLYHAESCRKKHHVERRYLDPLKELQDKLANRDAEWTAKVLGLEGQTMEPDAAAEWLKRDRYKQIANVVDSTRFKGAPKHY
jgi:hypothetical protein